MSNNIPTWPARTGMAGVALLSSVAVALIAAACFVCTLIFNQ
ncbi:hypothetical protein [Mycetocola sp. 2940]